MRNVGIPFRWEDGLFKGREWPMCQSISGVEYPKTLHLRRRIYRGLLNTVSELESWVCFFGPSEEDTLSEIFGTPCVTEEEEEQETSWPWLRRTWVWRLEVE